MCVSNCAIYNSRKLKKSVYNAHMKLFVMSVGSFKFGIAVPNET